MSDESSETRDNCPKKSEPLKLKERSLGGGNREEVERGREREREREENCSLKKLQGKKWQNCTNRYLSFSLSSFFAFLNLLNILFIFY
jgi:hypothetical protein